MRVIRQPYLVDKLVVTELTRETPSLAVIYKNELDMAVAAFVLQNNDPKKLKVRMYTTEIEPHGGRSSILFQDFYCDTYLFMYICSINQNCKC